MPLKLYRRDDGPIWHYRGTVAGRRLRGSTGTEDKRLAQRIASSLEERTWKGDLDGPAAHLTFAQAAIAYREAGKPTRFLARVEDHWKDTPVKAITPGLVHKAARELYPRGKPATRIRQAITPTVAIINHAAELGWCSPLKVKRPAVEAKPKRPADAAWAEAFVAHASPHLGALCLFMLGTGARISEALRVTWADVELGAARATIRQTKAAHTRLAHLPARVVAALANIPGERKGRVFGYVARDSVFQPWAHAVARAGIEALSPHCCRHGFATALLRAGLDVKTVAKLGGWKDAATVLRTYAHALDDPRLSDAVFDAHMTREVAKKVISI